jgi:hypothetical protein
MSTVAKINRSHIPIHAFVKDNVCPSTGWWRLPWLRHRPYAGAGMCWHYRSRHWMIPIMLTLSEALQIIKQLCERHEIRLM